jgi:TonB family protein
MRSMRVVGSAVLCAAALGAQSPPQAEMPWRQFRAPDSTFAIMFHSFLPPDRSAQDSGYVTEDMYMSHAGTTTFSVRRQSHRAGASTRHMPSVDAFCATCRGHVVSDTTIRTTTPFGKHAGRWVLVDRESPDSNSKTIAAYRLMEMGPHLYVVSAESAPGQPLSQDSGWFLESFRLCLPSDPCPVVGDGPPPWTVSPFQYLPPAFGGAGEAFSSTQDHGQAFLDYQVDEPARRLPDSPEPIYPAALKARGVEGEVVVTFVVSTSGAVELPTFTVVRSTDSLFVSAVRAALRGMRFLPASADNKNVRQLVQQSFPFKLPH